MSIQAVMETKLIAEFSPEQLGIDNDSKRPLALRRTVIFVWLLCPMHSEGQTGSNISVRVCLFIEELRGPVHALQMKCLTPEEYEAADGDVTLKAPPCGGGHRHKA